MEKKPYFILAYYYFTEVENPLLEVQRHRSFLQDKDVTARIYLSEQGINGQMCARCLDAEAYMQWMHNNPHFKEMEFKLHESSEHVFPRLTIKYRKQLVALDYEVDLHQTGKHLSPKRWKEMLEKRDENTILIDVRNQYEWEIGHFEGAILPCKETFREFPQIAEDLSKNYDKEQSKIMMYCTGGIRCELFSALLKEKGFKNVFQLQGGVIKYGLENGNAHWKGKLFVFDDRLVVALDEKEMQIISKCLHCEKEIDTYYNCANMDCNALFICCSICAKEQQGCCSRKCSEEGRVRPMRSDYSPKPFRRLPFEEKRCIST